LLFGHHPVLLAEGKSKVAFIGVVVKRADLTLVASLLITGHELVLLRMVEPLYHGVTLEAFQTTGARLPAIVSKDIAVFSTVSEQHRRPSEVHQVVGVIAAHGLM